MANLWTLYQHQPSFVLGFHGTDRTVVNQAVSRKIKHLKKSEDTTVFDDNYLGRLTTTMLAG